MIVAVLALVAATAPPAAPPSGVPGVGTTCAARLDRSVTSASAHVGDTVPFTLVGSDSCASVAGARGTAVVSAVSRAAGARRASLELAPRAVTYEGRSLPVVAVSPAPLTQTARRHIFPIPIPVGGVLMIGGVASSARDVTIAAGTTFSIRFVAAPEH